ncbi:hypothetical protein NDU88_004625 [Pleurodeles waltl]|uniref:Uncharacterized protein n=1 Tax=Pleurodeles waltl TaxID=8319 RepID=A0AAV7W8V5_PLEWA|nr:hypothetical protein NDU88_004625 [Pleurodeles waltl]
MGGTAGGPVAAVAVSEAGCDSGGSHVGIGLGASGPVSAAEASAAYWGEAPCPPKWRADPVGSCAKACAAWACSPTLDGQSTGLERRPVAGTWIGGESWWQGAGRLCMEDPGERKTGGYCRTCPITSRATSVGPPWGIPSEVERAHIVLSAVARGLTVDRG